MMMMTMSRTSRKHRLIMTSESPKIHIVYLHISLLPRHTLSLPLSHTAQKIHWGLITELFAGARPIHHRLINT